MFAAVVTAALFSGARASEPAADGHSARVYVGLGGRLDAFQDARSSDLQLRRGSVQPSLGFRYVGRGNYVGAQARAFLFGAPEPPGPRAVSSSGYTVGVRYLRETATHLYVGGAWDVVDQLSRTNEGLGNSSLFYHNASDLYAAVRYARPLRAERLSLDLGLGLGLASAVTYAPSFGAALSQQSIARGELSYTDPATLRSFSLRFRQIKPFWEQPLLRFDAELVWRAFSVAYRWRVRTFRDQPERPVTLAEHGLQLRWHFVRRGY